MNSRVFLDSFTCLDELPYHSNYEAVKAAVIKAGRFSLWDASKTRRREFQFTRLCQDPELRITNEQFPWARVERMAGATT